MTCKNISIVLIFIAVALLSCNTGEKKSDDVALKSEIDSVSYAIGSSVGNNIIKDSLHTLLNHDAIVAGLLDQIKGNDIKINSQESQRVISTYFRKKQEAETLEKFGDNKKAGEEFLAENEKREEVTVLPSGLQYEVLKKGNGESPGPTDKVKVHYHGTLIDGTVFDSSIDKGEPAEFMTNRVIKGWSEALQLMKEGSKWKIYIPQELAYGSRVGGRIKPFSTLIFEVELLEILEKPKPSENARMGRDTVR